MRSSSRFGLISRIALYVVWVELVAFSALGWYYIDRFSAAIDERTTSHLNLLGRMIGNEELAISAIARPSLVSDLIGAPYLGGLVIGGNGRVIVSSNPSYLGLAANRVPGFATPWTAASAPDAQIIGGKDTLTSVMHIHGAEPGTPIYHAVVTISTAEQNARKRSISVRGQIVSALFILLSSAGIVFMAQRLITRRVQASLAVLKEVENGALGARIAVSSDDELGQLQHGINSMTEKVGALLEQHRRNEEELGTILNAIGDGVVAVAADGRVMRCNPSAAAIFGMSIEAVERSRIGELLPELSGDGDPTWWCGPENFTALVRARVERVGSNGERRFIELGHGPIGGADGAVVGAVLVLQDVTARRVAEEQVRATSQLLDSIVENIPNMIFIKRASDLRYVLFNRAGEHLLGCGRSDVLGKDDYDIFSPAQADFFVTRDREVLRSTAVLDIAEEYIETRHGRRVLHTRKLALRGDDGEAQYLLGISDDITERKEAERTITELAFFDQLTGLPNRTLLMDRLKQAMTAGNRTRTFGAVLLIDLDDFKTLNDTLGHDMGDQLLKQVAERLTHCVRESDTAARLGGDEFIVVLSALGTRERAAATAAEAITEKLLATLSEHYSVGGTEHRTTASIGVTLFQGDHAGVDDLLKQVDLAMYRAKAAGRNAIRFFDPVMEAAVTKRAEEEQFLRRAIEEQQFLLHYQAQMTAEGRLTGAEVLVRWQHPERGMVPPNDFIPLAEETKLILPLGQWVLETACTQLARWRTRPEMAHLTIAVNVSAHQFAQPDFVDRVAAVLSDTGADPQRLKLELTESLLVSNVEGVIEKMFALKAKGVGFALDDFGTGYSSLSYLKRLPLDHLKIDRSFVRDVLIDPNDAAIAKTIVALAQSLGLGVIAEGVETEAQRDFLASSGCHAYQGFLFSRPVPLAEFEALAARE